MSRRRLPFMPGQIATIGELRPAGASWRAIGRAIGRPHVRCRRLWIREVCGTGSTEAPVEGLPSYGRVPFRLSVLRSGFRPSGGNGEHAGKPPEAERERAEDPYPRLPATLRRSGACGEARMKERQESAMSRPATPPAPSVGLMVAVCVCVAAALLVAFTSGLMIGVHRTCELMGQPDLPAVHRQVHP